MSSGDRFGSDRFRTEPMSAETIAQAQELIRRHGRRAPQNLVDEIQAALRRGDERAAIATDLILRAVDQEIWRLGNEWADAIQAGTSPLGEANAEQKKGRP